MTGAASLHSSVSIFLQIRYSSIESFADLEGYDLEPRGSTFLDMRIIPWGKAFRAMPILRMSISSKEDFVAESLL